MDEGAVVRTPVRPEAWMVVGSTIMRRPVEPGWTVVDSGPRRIRVGHRRGAPSPHKHQPKAEARDVLRAVAPIMNANPQVFASALGEPPSRVHSPSVLKSAGKRDRFLAVVVETRKVANDQAYAAC
jgi:hypothetical protein